MFLEMESVLVMPGDRFPDRDLNWALKNHLQHLLVSAEIMIQTTWAVSLVCKPSGSRTGSKDSALMHRLGKNSGLMILSLPTYRKLSNKVTNGGQRWPYNAKATDSSDHTNTLVRWGQATDLPLDSLSQSSTCPAERCLFHLQCRMLPRPHCIYHCDKLARLSTAHIWVFWASHPRLPQPCSGFGSQPVSKGHR